MQRWFCWLHEMDKRDEKRMSETEHRKLVGWMMSSSGRGAGYLHKVTKPTAWRGGLQVREDLEGNVKHGEM